MINDERMIEYIVEHCDSFVQNENNLSDIDALFPQLSHSQIPNARQLIRQFFDNNDQFVCYGSTSMTTCYHTLYRTLHNNKIYNLYLRFNDNNNIIDETSIHGSELTQDTLRTLFHVFDNNAIYYHDMPVYNN
jgi:phosphatidate phosphatase APP1